jgi:hypothetical protein
MPSIVAPAVKVNITAASAVGVLTVDSTTNIYPGTNGWASKTDGSVHYRVRILAVTGSTTLLARRWPTKQENDPTDTVVTKHDQENFGAPRYGLSDLSALAGGSATLNIEVQTAPVDPAFAKRVVP